jgi:hypothetical protein
LFLPTVLAISVPFCAPAVRYRFPEQTVPAASLWVPPVALAERNLFDGPWGAALAPDPDGTYLLVEHKYTGVNPGMTVRDARGREWSVKQAGSADQPAEGPIEVVLSRVLSAVGYYQPPVYYLPAFRLRDDWGTRIEPGGRFRLEDKGLKDRGEWSWQQNQFVGTKPYQGLLTILMMFGSSDLKNSNNTLYEYRDRERNEYWYVVRDLGTALGETGKLAPRRGDAELFARQRFILGVADGFVQFGYRGWHQELVRRRIRPDDVGWAGDLLSGLSDRQWQDAFRAGGYSPDLASRFITTLKARIGQARQLARAEWLRTEERR